MVKFNIKSILLPYFPDNVWLRKYWWHRLVIVVGYIWLIFNIFGLILYNSLLQWKKDHWNYPSVYSDFWADFSAHIIANTIFFLPIGLFLINVLYRVVLYIVLSNKWRGKNGK